MSKGSTKQQVIGDGNASTGAVTITTQKAAVDLLRSLLASRSDYLRREAVADMKLEMRGHAEALSSNIAYLKDEIEKQVEYRETVAQDLEGGDQLEVEDADEARRRRHLAHLDREIAAMKCELKADIDSLRTFRADRTAFVRAYAEHVLYDKPSPNIERTRYVISEPTGSSSPAPQQAKGIHPLVRRGADGVWLVGERVFYSEAAATLHAEEHARLLDRLQSGGEPEPVTKVGGPPLKWLLLLGGVFALLSMCSGGSGEKTQAATPHHVALERCQSMFKRISKDPSKASVPYVLGTEDASAYYFAWGAETTQMRMRNGLGLEVPASGSCYVNKSSGTITQLTLNGQTII